MKRGNVCTCVFKSAELGDLAVPERVDVCPLLLDRAARRLADTTLDTHDDDGVALGDELARLELLKFEGFPEHGEELRDSLVAVASSGKRDTTHRFKPLLKRAGLPEIRFHDLRHTCATLLLSKNVNPKVVSEMLGHASIAITLDTYSHVLPTMQESAAEAMEDALS